MPVRRLVKHAREAIEVPRDLVLSRYPDFVTGGHLAQGEVPVFCFHSADPQTFERKVRYLAENGYSALSADAYFQYLMGAHPVRERTVLLTFDDGRATVRTIAWPILRRYGMEATVFLIPGRMRSQDGPLPPTWDDVTAGRATSREVLEREQGPQPFMTWEEVAALAGTGLFSFGSHSQTHGRVHTTPQLAGFVTPAARRGFGPLDVPLLAFDQQDRLAGDVPLGTPFFRSEPRLTESVRFYEDEEIRDRCVQLVADEGGEGFFYRSGWQRTLRRLLAKQKVHGRLETAAERTEAIRRELAEAKESISSRLGRDTVHLCYPWHASGPTARRLAREVGYRTVFCGKVHGKTITMPGDSLHAIARVGEDYVELLPGSGRATLGAILRRKWQRRLATIRSSGRP